MAYLIYVKFMGGLPNLHQFMGSLPNLRRIYGVAYLIYEKPLKQAHLRAPTACAAETPWRPHSSDRKVTVETRKK